MNSDASEHSTDSEPSSDVDVHKDSSQESSSEDEMNDSSSVDDSDYVNNSDSADTESSSDMNSDTADSEESQIGSDHRRRNNLTYQERREYMRTGRCFQCGEHGHIARYCSGNTSSDEDLNDSSDSTESDGLENYSDDSEGIALTFGMMHFVLDDDDESDKRNTELKDDPNLTSENDCFVLHDPREQRKEGGSTHSDFEFCEEVCNTYAEDIDEIKSEPYSFALTRLATDDASKQSRTASYIDPTLPSLFLVERVATVFSPIRTRPSSPIISACQGEIHAVNTETNLDVNCIDTKTALTTKSPPIPYIPEPAMPSQPTLSIPDDIMADTPDNTPRRSTGTKSLIKEPSEFNGNKRQFKEWQRQLFAYLRDPRNGIRTDGEKIDIALSYMRGMNVQDWVQNYYDNHFDELLEEWNVTWALFKQALNDAFLDRGRVLMAQEKLEAIQQGSDTADDFFKKFESLITEAGYQKDSPFIIRMIEKAVNPRTIDQIYGSRKDRIENYAEYKETIISIDEMWRRRQEQKRGPRGWNSWANRDTPRPNSSKPSPTTATQGDRKDGTGMTFGGAGRPMDLSKAKAERRCFNCGQRGHMIRDCPQPKKFTVRQTVMADPESNDRGAPSKTTTVRQAFMDLGKEERAALAMELGFVLPPQ
ncbi:hypothetical protein D9757_009186 [Collybiopsis confluens]|uniref:CCHC-type domain-containing protein n=3 Tax=Collybiopsis confluens TaxID=2823264 RepID=A0A8H5M3T1_9AGAR|nr:hypothetical protein D9757_009186 [Collybiopsis confluens]